MERIFVLLKERFSLSPKKRFHGKEISSIELPEFGIVFVNVRFQHNYSPENYHVIEVDRAKLDDLIYISHLATDAFWKLIESGYLRKIRLENSKLHKNLIFGHKWGTKIIERRLEFFRNKPKYSFLKKENEKYLNNFSQSFMVNPEFFDFL